MMKQYKDFLFVEVPEDATQFEFTDKDNWPRIQLFKHYNQVGHIDTPPGSWQIIGKADLLKDEDWEGIVEHNSKDRWHELFKDYTEDGYWFLDDPKNSGLSLLTSHNLEAKETLVCKLIK